MASSGAISLSIVGLKVGWAARQYHRLPRLGLILNIKLGFAELVFNNPSVFRLRSQVPRCSGRRSNRPAVLLAFKVG